MKPQEDYNKWVDKFKSELENEKKFYSFYPDCIELINQYIQNGTLSPPINKYSDTFVSKSIPSFIKPILKFKSLSKEIIDATIVFLSKVLSLLTYCLVKGNLDNAKLITDILDPKLNLYTRPKLDQFQRLCESYTKNGDYDKLLERTAADNSDFLHFRLIFKVRDILDPYVTIPISKILPILYKFITHFKDDVSLRTIDTVKFGKIISQEILDNIDDEDKTDYTDLFNLSLYLIKTEIFDKQLLGVEILLTYIDKVSKSNESFSKWVQTTDLLNYLGKADFHVEIIKRIQPIVKYCSKKHLISIQMIESLLERAVIIHKSEREPMYQLIFVAFKGYDNKALIDFLQKHEIDNLFLATLMVSSKDFEIVQYCAITLLQRQSKNNLLSRLNKDIRKIIIAYINQNFKTLNLTYLQEILPELIDTSKDAVKEFDENVNLIIHDYGGIEDKQEFVLFIYKSYLQKTKKKAKITINITKRLFKCPSDNLWTFFNDLLTEIGRILFDSESYQFIDNYLQSYDYSNVSSEKFIAFMNTYSYKSMDFHNKDEAKKKSNNSSSDSDSDNDIDENFDFLSFPSSFLPIFIKSYFTYQNKSDTPIFQQIQKNLISFYLQLEDDDNNETMAKAINDVLIPYLDNKSTDLEKERTLNLLINLLNKAEDGIYLEDFGKQRHKEEIMFYPEITLCLGNSKKIIHQDPEVQCSALLKRIKTFTTGVNSYYYKLKIYAHSVEVEKTRTISSLHVSEFTVKNYGKIVDRQMISIILHDKYQLTKKLLDLLNRISNKTILDLVWELIQLLPSLKDFKVDDLHTCKNEYLLRYSLDLISIDKSFNNYSLLIELLISRKLKHSDIFIMKVILRLFNDEFVQYFPEICKIILEQFENDKNKEDLIVPSNLLLKLSKKYNGSDKIMLKYTDKIVTMIFSVTKDTIQPIVRTLDPIRPLTTILDKTIEKFESIKNYENKDFIIKCLFSLYQDHYNDFQSKNLIQSTMNIADLLQCDTLLKIINIVLKTNQNEKDYLKKYIFDNLLDRIFKEDNNDEFNSFLDLKDYYNDDVDNSLEKLLTNPETKCKAFNVKPPSKEGEKEEDSNDNEFRGMENLGVTCFMNSTLQQLFFTFPFRYLVLSTEKDTFLYNIFSELVSPKKESVSMKQYAEDANKIISIHSQQDAYEFYQLLMDKQNEQCQSIFKGQFINHIEGINHDYSSINKEVFTGIDLTINGKKNLNESFETLCEAEIFPMSENKEVRKYQRILQAPQALVIQLKRFEIDYNTFARYKINSKYEFPQSFDIAPYMDDKNIGEKIYELFGVVIHSGSADSGHYYSLIKLNNKWYEFNDTLVREFPEEKFEKVVFGSKQSSKSGYLLFYHEKDAEFNVGKIKIRYDQISDPSLVNEILDDLNKEKTHYCLFNDSLFQFANNASLEFQIYYFFKVFLHSAVSKDECNEFMTKLSNNLNNNKKSNDSIKLFHKLAVDEVDSFVGMLIKCKSDDIINSSISLVGNICENKYSFNFYDTLIQNLEPFIIDWSKFDIVSDLLLKSASFHVGKAKSNQWDSRIIQFIQKFYKEASSKAKENIDFTDFYKILKILKVTDLSLLENDFKSIILSPSNASILILLDSKQKEKIFSLFDKPDTYVSFVLESVFKGESKQQQENAKFDVDFIIDSIFEHPPKKMLKQNILKSVSKELRNNESSSSFKDMLLNNYSKIILPLLFDSENDVRVRAETITYQLLLKSQKTQFYSSSSSSSSDNEDKDQLDPKYKIITKETESKSFREFIEKLPDYGGKAVVLIENKYSKQSSIISEFLRILIWCSEMYEIFNILISIYQVVNKKNEKETNPDPNFVAIVTALLRYLNDCNEEKENILQYEKDCIPIIYRLFKFGSCNDTCPLLFEIMSLLSDDSLINLYKSNEFMSFFKKETKLKKSETSFLKNYNLKDMFKKVVKKSDEIANNLLNFVQKESTLDIDHMTLTLIIKYRIELVSDQLYLNSIEYIIDCALGNADFDLFMDNAEIINKTFKGKINDNFDFSKIEKKLIDSLNFLKHENSKSRRYYGLLVKNICSKSEKMTKIILSNLIESMISTLTNDKNHKLIRYYLLTFENSVIETKQFEYFNTFIEKVMPLEAVSFWSDQDNNPYDIAEENYDKLSDSKIIAIKAILIEEKVSKQDKGIYEFVKKFYKTTPLDKLKSFIEEIEKNKDNYDEDQLSCLQYNYSLLSEKRPEIKDVLNVLENNEYGDSYSESN